MKKNTIFSLLLFGILTSFYKPADKKFIEIKEGTIINLYDAFGKDTSLIKDFVTLARHHILHGTLAELFAQTSIDRLVQSRTGTRFITAHRNVIKAGINNAPLDVRINQHILFLRSDEALRISIVLF